MRGAAAPVVQPPAVERRWATFLVFVLLCIGFLILVGVSSPALISAAPRTLSFTSQDIPPYVRYGAFSKAFWLGAGEAIKPDLTDMALNATSGAEVWRGPPDAVFLHLPLNQSGPQIVSNSVAPADGYYVLEVHHNDCQSEVELCPLPSDGIVFETQGTVIVYPPRPYPYVAPSSALITDVLALTGLGLSVWFLLQWRSHQASRLRDLGKRAAHHPVVLALVGLATVTASVGGVAAYYGTQLDVRVLSMGSFGFASDQPCIPGEANPMIVYVWVYNGADEYVRVDPGVVINGTTYSATGTEVWPRSWASVGALYTSYDCKDPAARAVVLSAEPRWL